MDYQESPIHVDFGAGGAGACHVRILGSIHLNVAWLEGELKRVIDAKPRLVELDLSKTDYISSMGLGTLCGFRNSIADNGGVVRIVAIERKNYSVFQHAYLTKLFELTPAAIIGAPA
jgi:anti-anti-sigma factor